MRDYNNMTDDEFIKAYETPFTKEERIENHNTALRQFENGETYELTDKLIDEIFNDEEV